MSSRNSEKQDVLFMEFSPVGEITEKVRVDNLYNDFIGSVRIQNAMYRTAEEDRFYREKSLERKLP